MKKFYLGLFFIVQFVAIHANEILIDTTCVNLEEKLYLQYFIGNFENETPKRILKKCNLVQEEVSFKEAKFKYNTGKLSESKLLFAKIAKDAKGKELAHANYYLGLISYYQQSYNEAIGFYKKAESYRTYQGSLNFEYGQCYYALKLYKESVKFYSKILKIDQSRSSVWNNIGVNAEAMGDNNTSLYCYLVADSLAEGTNPLYKSNIIEALKDLGRKEEALSYAKLAYQQFPNYSRIVDRYGLVLGYLNRYEEAKPIMKKFLNDNGDDADIYFRLGYSYDLTGGIDSAFYYYYKSLAINPNQEALLHNMSLLYRIIGKFDLALKYVHASLEVDKEHKNAWNGLVNIHTWMHNYEKAVEAAKVFAEKYPSDPDIHAMLGYTTMLNGDYEKAIPYFFEDLKIDSIDSKPYNNLGKCYAKLGQFSKAKVYFKKAIEQDSTNSYIYHNRASMYLDLQEYDLACIDLRKAIQEEYNWVIDSTLYQLVDDHCNDINLNRRINFHGYKGNLIDMQNRSFIDLIEGAEKDYEMLKVSDSLSIKQYESELSKDLNTSNKRYSVYPNPTSGNLTIQYSMDLEYIKVFDSKGVQILFERGDSSKKMSLDLSSFGNGIYLVIASNNKEVVFTEQIVKQ